MKKQTIYLIILLCSYSFQTSAQQKISIWSGLAPGTEDRENTEYWNEDSTSVREVFQPDLTIFLPAEPVKHATAVLICPGGGYNQVVIKKEGYKLAKWLNENNITAFVLKYRLDPKEALRDAQRAISFIRSRADEYNIDANKIGVMGFSAGAHLSFNLCVNNSQKTYFDMADSVSSRPDFFVGVYSSYRGIVDLSLEAIENATEDDNPNLPPTFLVHAGNDTKAPVFGSVLLYLKLKKMGVPAELHVYEFGEHGFAIETNRGDKITSTVNSWKDRLLEWMKIKEF